LNFPVAKQDSTGAGSMETAYDIEQGTFASPIAADESYHLSFFDMESHSAQDLDVSVVGGYVFHTKHGFIAQRFGKR
jgi:hypothetical protein